MPDDAAKGGGFGQQFIKRLEEKGISKGQIYKVLALQRLTEDVNEIAAKANLPESILLEVSKVETPTHQKQLAEVIVEYELPLSWAKELSKLIRVAEKRANEDVASKIWDFFFEVKDKLEEFGTSRSLMNKIKTFRENILDVKGAKVEDITEDDHLRKIIPFKGMELAPGRGLDVGTANIVAAAKPLKGEYVYNIQRDAFLDLRDDKFGRRLLHKLGFDYTTQDERLYVCGDPAFELANIFEKDTRRPMRDGMISPYEPEALIIVNMLISKIMGSASTAGEICAFSVPADPIDVERDNIYHQGVLESLLRKLGYTPKAILEGLAIVYAALEEDGYTGIGISCGGGMFNVCVSYKSIPALAFSTSRGGDWIDKNVSKAVGLSSAQVCAIKESGIDLTRPRNRIEEAIVIYYRNLIKYTIDVIREKLEKSDSLPALAEPVKVVCAGGTALANGFIEIFRQEFDRVAFPIPVKSVEVAPDALRTVALGCLKAALHEMEARTHGETRRDAPFGQSQEKVVLSSTALEKLTGMKEPVKSAPEEVHRAAPKTIKKKDNAGAAVEETRLKMKTTLPPSATEDKPAVEEIKRGKIEKLPPKQDDEPQVQEIKLGKLDLPETPAEPAPAIQVKEERRHEELNLPDASEPVAAIPVTEERREAPDLGETKFQEDKEKQVKPIKLDAVKKLAQIRKKDDGETPAEEPSAPAPAEPPPVEPVATEPPPAEPAKEEEKPSSDDFPLISF